MKSANGRSPRNWASPTGRVRCSPVSYTHLHLEYYDAPVLAGIVRRSARILDVSIDDDAAHEVALRSRGTPRIANALLRRVRDFAMVKGEGHIDLGITRIGLSALNIDSRGLDQMDNKILGTIIEKFGGGPVGLNTCLLYTSRCV